MRRELITKKRMYEENTIAVKYINEKRDYPSCEILAGTQN